MGWASARARHGLRGCVLGLAATAAVLTISSDAADARRHHHRVHVHYAHHGARVRHHASSEGYSPPSASIIVDGNTDEVLQASNPDALRHPASLTKIMTLYLLFERLQAGKIRLDTPLRVSEHAAEQAPTKLGLKPGQTIAVEDAIKGVVTRSANDVAVVIAENLGGDEDTFARMMTQKAHALGMSHTTYVNASGLPDDDQITTARDQALIGHAIQDHFPHYYKYFSTTSFTFRGETIHGHNHLLGSVNGVDGIKTGFTRASGFNLVTSVHRDGRYIVGVVLGGRSAFERDAHMRQLIEAHIREAEQRRTAPAVAERAEPKAEAPPVVVARASAMPRVETARAEIARVETQRIEPAKVEPAPVQPSHPRPTAATATARVAVGSSDPIRPVPVKTVSYRTVTVRTGTLAPMPVLVPASSPAPPSPQAAPVAAPRAADVQSRAMPVEAARTVVVASAEPARVEAMPAAPAAGNVEPAKPVANAAPTHPRGGWMIQIGAFEAEDEARQHLSEAQLKLHGVLATADPFTERVRKGDKALYRARFAGFDKTTAEAACRELKRSDFECISVKD